MFDIIQPIFSEFWTKFAIFLPNFLGGILILIVGLIIAGVLKKLLIALFSIFQLDKLSKTSAGVGKNEIRLWEEVLVEVLRWTVVVLFLIPTLEVWGLSRATIVLNQLLFYLPNVIIAVVIGFVGLVFSNLVSNLVKQSVKSMGASSANALSVFAKTSIIFFTVLVILNQLGVAQDLIRILFTGIVGMLALAGGLAFGLGGKGAAEDLINQFKKRLK